jgi:hypothetical protein
MIPPVLAVQLLADRVLPSFCLLAEPRRSLGVWLAYWQSLVTTSSEEFEARFQVYRWYPGLCTVVVPPQAR